VLPPPPPLPGLLQVRIALELDGAMLQLAEQLKDMGSLLFFARGNNYATALEAALKVGGALLEAWHLLLARPSSSTLPPWNPATAAATCPTPANPCPPPPPGCRPRRWPSSTARASWRGR